MKRRPPFCVAAFALTLGSGAVLSTPAAAAAAQDPSPFGLRNIDLLTLSPENPWVPQDFIDEFAQPNGGHRAGHVAFWTHWGDFQPEEPGPGDPCPDLCFDRLDAHLAAVEALGADPVIVFHLDQTPPTLGGCVPNPPLVVCPPFWAMTFAGAVHSFTGPEDLIVPALESCPSPDISYSPSLYAVSHDVAEHIAQSGIVGTVWMRFHNESWDEWPLGTPENEDDNLYRYLLSYLTFRRAILDAEAVQTNVTFKVSHGSIPRERITINELYDANVNATPAQKQQIADFFDSVIERSRCTVTNNFPELGDPAQILDWDDAGIYAADNAPMNHRHDLWLDSFIEWTALCADSTGRRIFEFTNTHPHGKPALYYYDRYYFDNAVEELMAQEPPEWIGAEVAFQLSDQENWGVYSLPGPLLDKFIADDMGRKWCTMLGAEATLFCSPIVGSSSKFRGLYRKQPQPSTGCGSSSGEPQQLGSTCSTGGAPIICDDPANAAFVFLSKKIGRPDSVEVLGTPEGSHSHYRFHRPQGILDALWRNERLDASTTASSVPVTPPPNYYCGDVYNVIGTQVGTVALGGPTGHQVNNVSQAPLIIHWRCKLQQH